jgi:hypothetical protein
VAPPFPDRARGAWLEHGRAQVALLRVPEINVGESQSLLPITSIISHVLRQYQVALLRVPRGVVLAGVETVGRRAARHATWIVDRATASAAQSEMGGGKTGERRGQQLAARSWHATQKTGDVAHAWPGARQGLYFQKSSREPGLVCKLVVR